MENIKITAIYKNGTLIPTSPLNLKDGIEVAVILQENLYNAFSLAGEDSNVEDFICAQKEIIENE